MTDDVRLGFVGLGNWGTNLARAAQRSGLVTVAGGFARSADTRAAFAEAFGCESSPDLTTLLASDIDGVVIATPHSTHADLVAAAAAAGKHVFVEKPLTLDVASARKAVQAAEASGVLLQVGHHRRRLAATRALRRLVDDGELGTLHLLEAAIMSPAGLKPKGGWQAIPEERPLGGMSGLGVHMLDNLQYLAGPAARVSVHSRAIIGDTGIDEATTFQIEYASGPLAVMTNATIGTKFASLAAHGTAGSAWSEDDGTRLYRQAIDASARTETPVEPIDALADQMAAFATCIRTGSTPEVDGWAALEIVAVLEAGVLSAQRGQTVEVDEVREAAAR